MRNQVNHLLLSGAVILLFVAIVSLQGVLGDAADPSLITLQSKNIKASSELVENGKPQSYYSAEKALDGKKNTAWCASKSDAVPGAAIEMTFAPALVRNVHVLGGYGASISLCRHNNQIRDTN